MNYRCLNCKKDVEFDPKSKRIRCPYCGYRIVLKTAALPTRRVVAR